MRAPIARIVAGIALLLSAGAAHAECVMIQPFVFPCGTETVPPNPRLTLFWPRGLPPRAPALLVRDEQGWSEAALRWLPNEERRGEGRWGPEIKEHSFRFARIGDAWILDGYSPGD